MTALTGPRPSASLDAAAWDRAHDELVELLRALIRLPTVNPPGDEIVAARNLETVLADVGVESTILEPLPGRGSVLARLHGDGSGGGPLLLLSHLDVVPAPPDGWRHDPFGGEIADGYVWGRGAVDMKGMVAMEVAVVRRLALEARAAGRDPATDPIPGLTRDVVLAATADEEAGGFQGAGWIAEHAPDWLRAAGAVNECGGVSVEFGGRRFYPIQVAEKGFCDARITVRGAWGHGSMPRPDNAAVRAAEVVARLARPGPVRLTPVMRRFFATLAANVDPRTARALRGLGDPSADEATVDAAIEALCEEPNRRAARALVRDTISPNMIRAGVKYNVVPGTAEVEIDCRTLPGTTLEALLAEIDRRLGDDLRDHCTVEPVFVGAAVEVSTDTPLYRLLEATIREHDPDGIPLPAMPPFATDAKHTVPLGTPTYGFSPLRLRPDDRFLELFHGTDERVGLDALRFGLPVLYDVVRRFCG